MASLVIKGMHIGSGQVKTIVPLLAATQGELVANARQAVDKGADCVEWRADYLLDPFDTQCLSITAQALGEALNTAPLIATLRTRGQGGRLEADDREYATLVRSLVLSGGPDLVDIESGAGENTVRALVALAREQGMHTIVSHHDFEETPPTDWMVHKLCVMAELGADIPKLAVMAHSAADSARLLEATALASERLEMPVLTMAMGSAGTITRLAGGSFGNALTFCSLLEASAPGQVSLVQTRAALSALPH